MINGRSANAKKMSLISCYIQQEDLFFGTLTVKEHLEFHVRYFFVIIIIILIFQFISLKNHWYKNVK